jgi:hypothetical protein
VFDLDGEGKKFPLILDFLSQRIKRAVELRRRIEEMRVTTAEDVEAQEELLRQCEELMARAGVVANWLVGLEFQMVQEGDREARRLHAAMQVATGFDKLDLEKFRQEARTGLRSRPTFHWPLEFPEVFVQRGGFDAIVGNPPFMGGQKITGNLGEDYREYLVKWLAKGQRGSADLVAYFFLRARQLLREGGGLGLLATNTIAQGDTREVGLDQLTAEGSVIPRAVPSRKWPGTANLEVAHVWLRRGTWPGPFLLDEKPVAGITAFLTPPGAATGKPYRLKANEGKSFQGSIVLGMGFVLEPEEAQRLIDKDARNRNVLFPYLNGEDLNSRPDQSPSRWVINFFDWPLDRDTAPTGYTGPVAADYPDCLTIIEGKVRPERAKNNRKVYRDRWWQYAEKRPDLYATIKGMKQVMVCARVSAHHFFSMSSTGKVFADRLVVMGIDGWDLFTLLSSTVHDIWAHRPGMTTHETRNTYFPEEAFETFPVPASVNQLADLGSSYNEHRRQIMAARQEGLTKTYNRCHGQGETSEDIRKLRQLHVAMDQAVAAAYGWNDLDLGHDFHQTRQGVRYTISEPARQEVLARLLTLNHQRYEEEVRQGLHEQRKSTARGRSRASRKGPGTEPTLFGNGG